MTFITQPAKYKKDSRKGRVSKVGMSDWDEVMETGFPGDICNKLPHTVWLKTTKIDYSLS